MWNENEEEYEYYVVVRRRPLFAFRENVTDITPPYRREGLSFSDVEKKHLLIATLVLTVAFALMLSGGLYGFAARPAYMLIALPLAFVIVVTAFLLHELAHKAVAQKYGCWAEFRYWQLGLLFALFFSLFGFVFAAPGAVIIAGYVDRRRNGEISAAGPLTNIAIALIALIAAVFVVAPPLLIYALSYLSLFNLFLAGFNMIPLLIFDGAKVFRWSIPHFILIWALIIGTGAAWYYLFY